MKCPKCGNIIQTFMNHNIRTCGLPKNDVINVQNGKGYYFNCEKCEGIYLFMKPSEEYYEWERHLIPKHNKWVKILGKEKVIFT